MVNPVIGNLEYMSTSIEVMSHVKSLIHGLHVAYMDQGLESPDIQYVKSHKKEIFKQLESYRDQIYGGHELIDSINSCLKNLDVRREYFTEEVNDEDILDMLSSASHLVNSTIDAFNKSISLLDSLELVEDKKKLLIEERV